MHHANLCRTVVSFLLLHFLLIDASDVVSISVDVGTDTTTATVLFTLWFDYKIYQFSLRSPTESSTYTFTTESPAFTFLGCDYTNTEGSKMMAENNDKDALFLTGASFTTTSGDWYGIDDVCINPNALPSDFPWDKLRISEVNNDYCGSEDQFHGICVDNEEANCAPYKQIIYFDTTKPHQWIPEAEWSDGTHINPNAISCVPTASPTTAIPTTAVPTTAVPTTATQNPTSQPHHSPTVIPTAIPSISPTAVPTDHPIPAKPTRVPSQAPTDERGHEITSAYIVRVDVCGFGHSDHDSTEECEFDENEITNMVAYAFVGSGAVITTSIANVWTANGIIVIMDLYIKTPRENVINTNDIKDDIETKLSSTFPRVDVEVNTKDDRPTASGDASAKEGNEAGTLVLILIVVIVVVVLGSAVAFIYFYKRQRKQMEVIQRQALDLYNLQEIMANGNGSDQLEVERPSNSNVNQTETEQNKTVIIKIAQGTNMNNQMVQQNTNYMNQNVESLSQAAPNRNELSNDIDIDNDSTHSSDLWESGDNVLPTGGGMEENN